MHIAASEEFICLQVNGVLDVGQCCSINRINRILFVDQLSGLTVGGDSRWPVFLSRGHHPREALANFLNRPTFLSAVELIIQSPKDSLHIFRDGHVVYFQPVSSEQLQSAIQSLSDLVGAKGRAQREDLSALPKEFDPLIPLIRKWAESDDSWREEMLRRASKPSITRLIETVSPYLSQIDLYLRGNDDEAACALGTLAELTVEAQLELRNRRK